MCDSESCAWSLHRCTGAVTVVVCSSFRCGRVILVRWALSCTNQVLYSDYDI